MSGLLLKLLGVGRIMLDALGAVLRWLLADWRNAPMTLFAIGFGMQTFVTVPAWKKLAVEAQDGWEAEQAAHDQTVEQYRLAAAQAQIRAFHNAERVRAEQTEITQEIVDDYTARLAAVRSRAADLERLRGAAGRTATDPRRAGAAGLPGTGHPASGAGEAPGQDRLPATCPDFTAPDFTIEERLIATEQALQLDALIDWVEAQSLVEMTGINPNEGTTE